MITYIEVKGKKSLQCKVRLEKKIVGAIYKDPEGNGSAPAAQVT